MERKSGRGRFRGGVAALLLLLSAAAFGGVPPMIGIQGRLTGPGNQPLSGFRAYRVRFFNAATSGGRLAFFNGSYPEPATLTKKLRIDTLVNPTNLGF